MKNWGGHRGFYLGWKLFIVLLRALGRWPVYAAMVPMASFYVLFGHGSRRGLSSYLRLRFPTSSAFGRWVHLWRLFFAFATSLVDRFLTLIKGPGCFRLSFDYGEGVSDLRGSESGFIVLTSHLGNADLGAAALSEVLGSRRVYIVQNQVDGDPYVALLQELRGDQAPQIIALNNGAQFASLAIVRALKEGAVVAMKADRVVDDRVARVNCLGEPMSVPTGPFLLAAIAKAPVLVMGCFKEGWSGYRVVATSPKRYQFTGRKTRQADLKRWASDYSALLEGWARRYPHQWYNFFDVWTAPRVD